jgi:hypothetical protein
VSFETITDDAGKLKCQNVTSADGSPCPGPEPRERNRRGRKPKKDSSDEKSGDEEAAAGDDGAEGTEGKEPSDKPNRNARRRRRKNGKKEGEDAGGDNAEKPKAEKREKKPKPERKSWYDDLDKTVQENLESREIKMDSGRAFVSVGDARLKLGTGGYMSLAHATGMVAEGKYVVDAQGKIAATWEHVMKHDGSEWKVSTVEAENGSLMTEIDLTGGKLSSNRKMLLTFLNVSYIDVRCQYVFLDSVKPTASSESTETLWGEGKGEPTQEALEQSGFQMRKVAVVATESRGRRRWHGGRRNNAKTSAPAE